MKRGLSFTMLALLSLFASLAKCRKIPIDCSPAQRSAIIASIPYLAQRPVH